MKSHPCALWMFAGLLSAQQAPAPPAFRLGDNVRPTRYALDLKVIPGEDTFSGAAEIDVEIRKAMPVIWLNATELQVGEASVIAGGAALAARPLAGGANFLGLALDRPVSGRARLRIAYQGKLHITSSSGLFKMKEAGEWYAFSQFEPTDARTAFPCFDEPSYKVPWQLTLHVKKEHLALSNTPVLAETDEPGGMKAVKFRESKPMPSYLLALAVGPFEVVEAGKVGRRGTPLRIITERGRAAETRYAVEVTPRIVALLEDYFGTPYPYEKLDSLAVPLFGGAMENPGLVTFGQTLILSPPDRESIRFRRAYASIAAHELAHLWFGDLVTTAWWDDIWLNEAFASWMADKIVERLEPGWNEPLSAAASRLAVMGMDGLVSARKIRQPIKSADDIADAFDRITYDKGDAVIHMFEAWIGPEKFRRGVQLYLAKHAWKNATAANFLTALSKAAGQDVAPAFSTFLDEAGVPLITAALRCGPGNARLELSQKRYLPLGSKGSARQVWQVPVCYAYGDGGTRQSACTLLAAERAEVNLPSKACPDWVMLNRDEDGYYRVRYEGDMMGRLLAGGGRQLSAAERLGLLGDARALMASGDLRAADGLALVPKFAASPNRQIVSSTVAIVSGVRYLVPDELRPNYARFIRRTYGPRAEELGWSPKPGDDDETRLQRSELVSLVATYGEDKTLGDEAVRLARRWCRKHGAVAPEVLAALLPVAAHFGDRALFEAFHTALNENRDEKERQALIGALGSFRDPALVRAAFDMMLSDQLDMRESVGLLFGPLKDPATRAMPYEFVKANYNRIVAKLPSIAGTDFGAYLPVVATPFCDEARRADVEEFFKDRIKEFTGGPRTLAQTLERISLCSARRAAQQKGIAEFLKPY